MGARIAGALSASASIDAVVLDLTDGTESDVNSLVGTVTILAGVNSIPYQNASAATLSAIGDGATGGARWEFGLDATLPGFDIEAGDQMGFRLTLPSGSVDLDDVGILVGFRDVGGTDDSLAFGMRAINTTWYYGAYANEGTTATGGAVTDQTTASADVSCTGVIGWPVGPITDSVCVGKVAIGSSAAQQTGGGLTVPKPSDTTTMKIVVAMVTANTTDNGAKVAQVKVEVWRIPTPA